MPVLEVLPEGKNKAGWKHDTEITLPFIARSDLKLKSSTLQHKNNSLKTSKRAGWWCHHRITAALSQTGLIRRAKLNAASACPSTNWHLCLASRVKNCEGVCCMSAISQPNPEAYFFFMPWVQLLFHPYSDERSVILFVWTLYKILELFLL